MTPLEPFCEQIAGNLEQRRLELTRVRRVALAYVRTPLEAPVVRMAIPIIYAEWEGYVKEVCQLYLEHVEASVGSCSELAAAMLGYLWTPVLRPLRGGLNLDRKKAVAETALHALTGPVGFSDTEKGIDTKSNLNFAVLETIAGSLCLDITPLLHWKTHLNALVYLRNNIAHGARPQVLKYPDFDQRASETLALMEGFERVIISGVRDRAFCSVRPTARS